MTMMRLCRTPALTSHGRTRFNTSINSAVLRLEHRYLSASPKADNDAHESEAETRAGSQCPITGKGNATTESSSGNTELVNVPSLPYLGTLFSPYSKTPAMDMGAMRSFYPECRRRFGDFYKLAIPGLGKGRDGEFYVLSDPSVMQKIVRQERTNKPYPRGVFESEWPVIKWFQSVRKSPLGVGTEEENDKLGYSGRGDTWKRLRSFLQTDMLSPQAANGYIPSIVQAAKLASQGAPASSSELNQYLNRCSFDLFSSMMFSELTNVANPENHAKNQENLLFCDSSVTGMQVLFTLLLSPAQLILSNLGVDTSTYKDMVSAFDTAADIAEKKYLDFRKRHENGTLTEAEKDSYLGRAIVRQMGDDTISEEDLRELIIISLIAAIDTTSSAIGWNLMHLAINPGVQQKLRSELLESMSKCGGLNLDAIRKNSAPYLHAVVRETHRISPALLLSVMKENNLSEVEIHGSVIPKDSLFVFDGYSQGMDPAIVENPKQFQPERWLPDGVESRRGTPSEVIDHPYLKEPFSQGSRKCPGSRVATNEILIMLSQLILDWDISAPDNYKSVDDVPYHFHGMIIPDIPKLDFVPLR